MDKETKELIKNIKFDQQKCNEIVDSFMEVVFIKDLSEVELEYTLTVMRRFSTEAVSRSKERLKQ